MRHRKKFNHLSRTSAHRKAMLSNMATSLILHKRITTTTAKAKALRSYVEPLITRSKEDTTHSRRTVFSYLQSKDAVNELFREVSTKIAERPGGYTRIIKMGNRLGDNADMCLIELVDYNEHLMAEAASPEKKSTGRRRRRRGSGGSKAQNQETQAPAVEKPAAVETPTESAVEDDTKAEATVETTKEETKAEAKEEVKTETNDETKADAKDKPEAEVKEEPKAEDKAAEEDKAADEDKPEKKAE